MKARALTRLRAESGQGMVEFALVLPVLVAILLGIISLASAYSHQLILSDAVKASARAASVCRFASSNPSYKDYSQTFSDITQKGNLSGASVSTFTCPTLGGSGYTLTGTFTQPIKIFGLSITTIQLSSTTQGVVE